MSILSDDIERMNLQSLDSIICRITNVVFAGLDSDRTESKPLINHTVHQLPKYLPLDALKNPMRYIQTFEKYLFDARNEYPDAPAKIIKIETVRFSRRQMKILCNIDNPSIQYNICIQTRTGRRIRVWFAFELKNEDYEHFID